MYNILNESILHNFLLGALEAYCAETQQPPVLRRQSPAYRTGNNHFRFTCAAYFSAALNSWIHVVMYLYYLLAATIAKDEKRRRKYLFWGK